MSYKDMAFCAAKDCGNLKCTRNTNRPDFKPGDMPVCYAGYSIICEDYKKKKEQSK